MNNKEKIQKAIDFIELNLDKNISIEQVADHVHFSIYHFQRLFKEHSNFSIKDYIRKRRISNSASRLLCTDDSILDIAFDNHFKNHESFTRAFKRYYQRNPSSFRSNQGQIVHFEKLDLFGMTFPNSVMQSTVLPRLITQRSFKVIGIEVITTVTDGMNFKQSQELWKEIVIDKIIKRIPNKLCPVKYIGLTYRYDPQNHSYYYLIGALVSSLSMIPKGMTGVVIPPTKYVVFDASGIPDTIHESWDHSFYWLDLNQRSYTPERYLAFELYDPEWPLELMTRKQKLENIGYRWKEVSPIEKFEQFAHHKMSIYHGIYGADCTRIHH